MCNSDIIKLTLYVTSVCMTERYLCFHYTYNSSKPPPKQQEETPMCDVHEEEKINIYCVTHNVPTCSMCKVFGEHKDCEVAPISSIYQTKKVTMEDMMKCIIKCTDY